MEKRIIHQLLDDIASQEIPDDMNLWNDIQTKLPTPRKATYRHALTLTRVAAIGMLLLVSAVTYGFYQQVISGDPGLEAVSRANLITYFNETRTIEGPYNFEVSLEYAYADANRIVIASSAKGSAASRLELRLYPDVNLYTEDGEEIPYLPLGGGNGGGGGPYDPEEIIVTEVSGQVMFDSSALQVTTKEIPLVLEFVMGYSTTETGGGMLIGGTTQFNLTLPFNPGRVMDTPQTVTANGLEITLQKVVVAPSLTRIELCYQDPEPEGVVWSLYGSIDVDDKPIIPMQSLNAIWDAEIIEAQPCQLINLTQSLMDAEGEWQLTLTKLALVGSEDPNRVANRMAEAGYEIEVIPQEGGSFGYYYTDPNVGEYLDQVLTEERESIEGPWVFTFTVPD